LSGFNALAFPSAVDALHAAEAGCPDLLITDVSIPSMNGIDLAIRSKSLSPSSKVVLFSGHMATSGSLDAARGQGHELTVLAKPVHAKELLATMQNL
jgi:DNA-binding NtrC family response regulator